MHVHTRRVTLPRRRRRKPWAVVTRVGDRQIVRTFWTEGAATGYLNRTWPNHDPNRIGVEKIT